MKDTLVIDIETKNTFADVGRDNFDGLEISVIGTYSYNQDKYIAYTEHELEALGEVLKNTEMLVGFYISGFDLPVMQKHYPDLELMRMPRIDLFDEIELNIGKRISLELLAQANLGYGKSGHGIDAPILYKEGKLEELKNYCLQDVKVTKELYDLAKKQTYLMVPTRMDPKPVRCEFDWTQKLLYQRLF
jgi:predicted PolB exonuclease-like 3'-5' exonuclease